MSNPTKTVIQKKTVSRREKEGERENTGNRAEGLQPYKLTYNSDVESSGEERKEKTDSSNEGAFSDGDQHRVTVRKARVKRKVARKDRSSSYSSERFSDEGAVGGVVDRDQSDTERNQNKDSGGAGVAQQHQRGPNIRLPWFNGKEEEQVEKYFRELKRLKVIYDWSDDHLLNMAL